MKRELLLQILELTKLQEKALQEEDIELFGKILNDRQILMDKIDNLHKEYPELKLQKEEDVLNDIIFIDNMNNKEFKKKFKEVKNKLNQIRSRKKVNNAYNNPYDKSQGEGIFFDKR